jgi:hypothetical protein
MTLATVPTDHPTHKQVHHEDGVYFGLWRGPAQRHHGMSRQHQSVIIDTAGGEIFSEEQHPELALDQRVRFRLAMDRLGITKVAIGIEPVEPVAVIKDAKVAKK